MKKVDQIIDEITPSIKELRRELHRNPEPAFEEFETAGNIANRLKELEGFEVRERVAKTGVVATLGTEKEGSCIALRADMDCLKIQEENSFSHASKKDGLMHACGHDGHTACLLGAAMVLSRMKDELKGPVKFIFQPAEENKGGAEVMVDEGALTDPTVDAIFAMHCTMALPENSVGLKPGAAMAASRYFAITIQGKGCHAASPHRGVDPVLIGSQIICSVQSIVSRNISPLESGLITIPKITASTAPNVIPERVVLEGTLRALSNENRKLLEKRLEEVVKSTAAAYGGTAEIEYFGGYPLLENSEKHAGFVTSVAQDLLGEEKVRFDYPPSMGAEDFAFYLQNVPGSLYWLGMQPEGDSRPSLHHPQFDFNDEVIPTAIRLHCDTVLKYQNFSTI